MKAKKIEESLDFERGQTPMKSMGIGQEFKYKELENEFSKAFPELFVNYINSNYRDKRFIKIRVFSELNNDKETKIEKWFSKHSYFEIEDFIKGKTFFGDSYCDIVLKEKNLKESINFERDQDPKKSMDIGQTFLDKGIVKKIKSSLENVMGEMDDSFQYFPNGRKIQIDQRDFLYIALVEIHHILINMQHKSLKDKIEIKYEDPENQYKGILTIMLL
jgi:hypothetical protein